VSAAVTLSSRQGRGILITTVLGSGMVFLDGTVATVATKTIGKDFNASFGALQWVLTGYTLPLASLILVGGSLGDRFGRRRTFLVGVVWFAAASALCALAPGIETLVAARVLQGVGGALLTPGSLAIIQASFGRDDAARAVGAWAGLSGVTTAVGPVLGGFLVQDVSWRWAFAINVPLAVAVVATGLLWVPESSAPHAVSRPDVFGIAVVICGLGALTYGPIDAGSNGWSARSIAVTIAGIVLLGAFVAVERRAADPLVPLGIFADRTFSGANIMTFMTYGALSVMSFVLVVQLQVSAGYGALAAGIATLPVTVVLLVLSSRSGALAARIGPRLQMTVGPLLVAAGMALTTRIDAHHRAYLPDVLPGVLVFAFGLAALVAPLTATVMASVPAEEVGIASGVNNAVARAAGLLAISVLPAFAGLSGDAYRSADAMTHGFRIVVLLCVVMLVLGAGAVVATVRTNLRAA